MGSSPESQLIIKNKKAIIHPIAGTFKRTGNIQEDLAAAKDLKADPKCRTYDVGRFSSK